MLKRILLLITLLTLGFLLGLMLHESDVPVVLGYLAGCWFASYAAIILYNVWEW